jgi:hypothetical protein
MKKLSALILCLVVAILAAWILLANQFESFVKEQLPENLQKISGVIKTDPSLIKVDKYSFSLTTGETTFLGAVPFYHSHVEGLKVNFNPITQNITMRVLGDRSIIKIFNTETYVENPSSTIEINRSILAEGLDNLHIKFAMDKPYSLRLSNNSNEVYKADKSSVTITCKKREDGGYRLTYNDEANKIVYSGIYSALYNIIEKSDPIFKFSQDEKKFNLEMYNKIPNILGAFDTNLSLLVDLDQKLLSSAEGFIGKEQQDLPDLLLNLATQNKYLFDIHLNFHNAHMKDKIGLTLKNDGIHISSSFESDRNRNLSQEQRDSLVNVMAEIYYGLEKSKFGDSSVSPDDFKSVVSTLLNIKNNKLNLKADYDLKSKGAEGKLFAQLNEFYLDIAMKSNEKDKSLSSTIKLSDPNEMLGKITSIIEREYPLLDKLTAKYSDDNTKIKETVNNIKTNGYPAISAFHKDPELKPGEELVANLNFDFRAFNFKINDKGILQIITDKRVEKFMEEMARIEQPVKKSE